MVTLLVTLHVLVCVVLILVILLQTGKGAEMGATFGVGSSSAVFGPRGPAPLLSKVTVGAAVVFMVTSLVLTVFASRQEVPSLIGKTVNPPAVEQPVKKVPGPPPAVPVPGKQGEVHQGTSPSGASSPKGSGPTHGK